MPTKGSSSGRRETSASEQAVPSASATPAKRSVRTSTAKKPTAKRATKNAAAKKTTAKKSPTKKKPAKKITAKKSPAKKSTAKKSPTKKSTAKKSPTKKKPVKKTTAKKRPAKKVPAKKRPAKKVPAKRHPVAITRRVARKRPPGRKKREKLLIGWREWVVLPELTDTPIKAKVDSGAVTSSLHAFNLQIIVDGDETIARFGVAPRQRSRTGTTTVEYPVAGYKKVRSSNGQAELRPVIRTPAVIGGERFEIDITLASRDAMGFRMLLGRRAVRNRFVIDPGRSFLQPALSDEHPVNENEK